MTRYRIVSSIADGGALLAVPLSVACSEPGCGAAAGELCDSQLASGEWVLMAGGTHAVRWTLAESEQRALAS